MKALAISLLLVIPTQAQPGGAGTPFPNIGRPATQNEVNAWNIAVRADLKNLPKGSGSVALGEQVWERSCASCHGTFGESNEVFTPIVGGTTEADIASGHVASLAKGDVPQRTTLMKLAKISTLWDYIHRAMPWNAPKSLTVDEVYGATAFILNQGGIVPADFVLSDKNMADVQKRLPNRNGLVTMPGMWNTRGKGDIAATACMKDCVKEVKVTSFLPDYARNAHGNLAEQNRLVGGVRGIDTAGPLAASAAAPKALGAPPANVAALLAANGCTGCHAQTEKLVGPAFAQVSARHAGKADYLAAKIKSGGSGVWGSIPMPPQAQLKDSELQAIAAWLAQTASTTETKQ